MRNLVVAADRKVDLEVVAELGDVAKFSIDHDAGLIFVAGSGLVVAAYRIPDCELLWLVDLRERLEAAGGGAAPPPGAAVVACDFLPELGSLCLALSSGELLLLHPESSGSSGGAASGGPAVEVEEVGAVAGGLAAAAWSPDGELLLLVTAAAAVLLMTKDWELLAEVPLLQHREQPLAASAAAAALAGGASGRSGDGGEAGAASEQQAEASLAPGSVCVSWRGDGRFFATASLDAPGAAAATLRIWERDGAHLHAMGEAAPGLLPAVAWQPNGRHLYAAVSAARGQAAGLAAAGGGGAAAAVPAHKHQQPAPHEAEAAAAAAAEGIQHVGAWKRELRRRQAAREAGGHAGGGGGTAAASPAAGVLLFERNGLQHASFDLPGALGGGGTASGTMAAVEQLAWSLDSEFLAVVLAEADEHGLPLRVLQLWHRSNWHWYLKHERRYHCSAAVHVSWDAVAPLRLHIVSAEGAYEAVHFARQPAVSARGTAVVVDGASLALTPLARSLVPPPMAAVRAALPAPVACLAICDFGEQEAVAAVLSDGGLALLESVEADLWEETLEEQLEEQPWDGPGAPCLLTRLLAVASPALEAAAATLSAAVQAAAWAAEGRLLLAAAVGNSPSALLVELAVDAAAGSATEVAAIDAGVPPLLAVVPCHGGGVLLQAADGELLAYTPGGELTALPRAAGFPTGCPQMAALPPGGGGQGAGQGQQGAPAVGLSPRGELFWGGRQLAADVTSFAVRSSGPGGAFLLFTTRQHTLRTLPLATLAACGGLAAAAASLAGPQQQQQQQQPQSFLASMRAAMRPGGAGGPAGGANGTAATDVTVRSVEQGALLVAVPPGGVQAVLQMPRGNLEAVRPRALVLPAVAAALDAADFAGAWQLATANRLDLNVLVDHAWPRFLAQAPAFVQQVAADQDLADLLSTLRDHSTAGPGGLYAAALPPQPPLLPNDGGAGPAEGEAAAEGQATGEGGAGKVAAVCAAVRAALQQKDEARYLRSILTSHAQCGQLEAALALVQRCRERELQGVAPPPGAPSAEDGLRHLMLVISDDTLYRTALGMYELELAYMVVAHSQKDPGEYLLELQGFAAVADPHLRRHAIDAHLGHWDRALCHLVAAGEPHFGSALDLARRHGLLRLLLRLVEGDAQRAQRVHAAYAEALEAKNMPEDAGLAYLAAGLPDDAIRAYRAAGQWRMCFALAARAGWSDDARRRLAAGLAEELSSSGRAADAAAVTLQYLRDVDSAVLLLAHGKEWREALRLAFEHGRSDLVDTVVAPAAAVAAAAALEDIDENVGRVAKYGARLRQLRERRAGLAAALAAADAEAGMPSRQGGGEAWEDDAVSVADSLVSGLSIYTDATHTGATTVASTSLAPSTVGGKRRGAKRGKSKSQSSKIRQGSPQEEEQLAQHVLGLAPPAATCAEVGALAELLVVLGHAADAALLQQRLGSLVAAQAAAAADVLAHPPPALALSLPRDAAAALAAAAGPAAAPAAAAALAGLPGAALQQRVAAAEAAVREAHWKWDLLREAPPVPPLAAHPAGTGAGAATGAHT